MNNNINNKINSNINLGQINPNNMNNNHINTNKNNNINNNEKINSLHHQKFKFYEREVTNWKENYNILSKESKSKEQSLLNEIELLKNQIDNLKTEKKN